MSSPPAKQLEKFLQELMEIERRYANELKNAKTNRQEDVRELLDKHTIAEEPNAD